MPAARAYREVVPNYGVLFEKVLQSLRESQLATAVKAREAQARDQDSHATTERLTASSPARPASTPQIRHELLNDVASSHSLVHSSKDRVSHRLKQDFQRRQLDRLRSFSTEFAGACPLGPSASPAPKVRTF